jgi:hypothetical protein
MTQPPIVPGQQPTLVVPTPPQPRSRRRPPVAEILLGATIGATIGAAGFFAYRAWAPPGAPGKAPDSGIQACEDLRDGKAATSGSKTFTEQQYQEIRGKFAGSRDANLREQGTKLMDLVWQVSRLDDVQTQAWPYMPQLIERTAGLRSACADHGVILPTG